MDQDAILTHLVAAQRAVELGEQHLLRQRRLIADLERRGFDARMARRLLATFEQSQALHVFDRDRLQRDLAQALRSLSA